MYNYKLFHIGMTDEAWIDNVLQNMASVKPKRLPQKTDVEEEDDDDDEDDVPTMDDVLQQFAPDTATYNKWVDALDGYIMRTHTDELFTGDHTKYLDIKDPTKPILRKGGMMVRFDDDVSNVTLRMGTWIWTVKAESSVFFQKPGKQARVVDILTEIAKRQNAEA